MVIRENGLVVGLIDDATLEAEDVSSKRLQDLLKEWRAEGIFQLGPQDGALQDGQASGDTGFHAPWEPKYYWTIVNELENEGFDVQTA